LMVQAQLSQLEENGTFLSNYFSGAYKTGLAQTNTFNLIAKAELTNNLNFIAEYNKGNTDVTNLDDSVVSNMSDLDSEGYSLSLIKHGLYSKGDTIFTLFKQPLRVTDGDMTLSMADGLNLDDSIHFTDQKIALTPSGKEQILTLGYSTDYKEDIAFTLLLNHINNPNHDASASSDNQVMMKVIARF